MKKPEATLSLRELEEQGLIELGRGNVISKKDIASFPGSYPIYSSSIKNSGYFGEYGKYMFDEELISWSVDGGGNFFYRPKHRFSVTNVSGYLRILDRSKIDYKYLAYQLNLLHLNHRFDYQFKAHPSVIRDMYRVPLPGLSIQRKIAETIEMIDKQIVHTVNGLSFNTKLKKAMMQQLLIKGINHTDFKSTVLGQIPANWSVGSLVDYTDNENNNAIKPGPFGSSLKKSFYVADGYKVYGQEQVIAGDAYAGDYFIDENKYKELNAFRVLPGDVLISLVGTIGKVLVLPKDTKAGIINPRLIKITPDHKKADPYFIAYLLTSDFVKSQLAAQSHGGTMNILNKRMLTGIKVPIVPLREQEEIIKILKLVDEKNAINQYLKKDQEILKLGLMQDLLSGKVSV